MLSLCYSLGRKARCALPSQPFVLSCCVPSSRLPLTALSLILEPKRITFNIYNYDSHCFNPRRILLLTLPRHTGHLHSCIECSTASTPEEALSCPFWCWILIKTLELKKVSLWRALQITNVFFPNYKTLSTETQVWNLLMKLRLVNEFIVLQSQGGGWAFSNNSNWHRSYREPFKPMCSRNVSNCSSLNCFLKRSFERGKTLILILEVHLCPQYL